ncbi:MAG: Zn-ribbon domain-containing OB-fold protein [Porticoccaceae bacterium]
MAGKDYIDVRLADETATVVAFTIDHLTFAPEPPFQYGLVEFESGARVLMEFVDTPAAGIAVGDKVTMKFRIKSIDRERGYRHYFWKAAPVSKAEAQ